MTYTKKLSALVITFNEEANICRTLDSLYWVEEVLVVDSGSTDKTIDIVNKFRNTRIVFREFDTFAGQCNFGLSRLSSEWVLSLDADYVLSSGLAEEINTLLFNSCVSKLDHKAFKIDFKYCINGKPIRSSLLPARTCLYKKDYAVYKDEGHGHRIAIQGSVGHLRNWIFHDDRKPLSVWLGNQRKYQEVEAEMLRGTNSLFLPLQDKLRKHTPLAPIATGILCLFIRGGIFDGREGIIYAYQRIVAESLLYLFINQG